MAKASKLRDVILTLEIQGPRRRDLNQRIELEMLKKVIKLGISVNAFRFQLVDERQACKLLLACA